MRSGQAQHAGQSRHGSAGNEASCSIKRLQNAKIPPPATDCISPIGEQLLLKGLHHVVPAEFYVAETRPPAVYRGNPFLIEAALAYGGSSPAVKISLEALTEMLGESDARTLRQFLINGFSGIGGDAADKILDRSRVRHARLARQAEARPRSRSCTRRCGT